MTNRDGAVRVIRVNADDLVGEQRLSAIADAVAGDVLEVAVSDSTPARTLARLSRDAEDRGLDLHLRETQD